MKRASFALAVLLAACATAPAEDAPYLDDRLYPEAIQRASDTVTHEPVIQSGIPEAVHSDASAPQ